MSLGAEDMNSLWLPCRCERKTHLVVKFLLNFIPVLCLSKNLKGHKTYARVDSTGAHYFSCHLDISIALERVINIALKRSINIPTEAFPWKIIGF